MIISSDMASPFRCNVCLLFNPDEENNLNDLETNERFQRLLTCGGCQSVRYCSKEHQKVEWPLHKFFCQAIQKIKEKLKISHPFYISGVPKCKEDVEKAVIQLKFLLKSALGRSLESQEEDLSSFPVFCGQCFNMKGLKVICTICGSQAYCLEEHKKLHKEKHDQVCRLLEMHYCPYKVQTSESEFFLEFVGRVKDLHKMDLYEYIENAFGAQLPSNPCENMQTYQMFAWAADFSCITTICWVMELLEYKKVETSNFNIFILGASIEAWLWFREVHCRLFFLQNPEIKELELSFIGPEVLMPHFIELRFEILGCERLVKFNTFKGVFQDYHMYYKTKPCLIVAFNCGFSEFCHKYNSTKKNSDDKDTWVEALVKILQIFDTPIVFTSFTEQEAAFDFGALQNAANKLRVKINIDRIFKVIKNPFRDFRPLRQWYSLDQEEFYYRNGYIQAIRTRLAK